MADRRAVLLGAALVTVLMVLSSMGLLSGLAGATGSHPATAATVSATTTVSSSVAPARIPGGSTGFGGGHFLPTPTAANAPTTTRAAPSVGSVSPVVAKVESQIANHQINPSSVFLPSAFTHTGAAPASGISPTYPGTPAPMGLADLGVGAGGNYEYNTTSFASFLTLNNFTDYNPGYAGWDAPPNYMTFQLNTVTVNVSYPGGTHGVFWIKNVAHFNGTDLQFENNIWNMTAAGVGLNAGTLAPGYQGTLVAGEFYYTYGPLFQVHYPFSLNLYNNISTAGGVPSVYFNYTITNATLGGFTQNWSAYYDHVTFNGNLVSGAPPEFEVNGYNYNPAGLLWDAELIFGGNGGGANAVITQLNGSANLESWNNVTKQYTNVSSAYDYGEDTGETAVGVASYYLGTTEYLSQGPSILYGLWNTANSSFGPAALPGWISVTYGTTVNYAFSFFETEDNYYTAGDNWSYAPTDLAGIGVTRLPPVWSNNEYDFAAWADGYDPVSPLIVGGNTTVEVLLNSDPSVFNAPVYLSSDAQASSFGFAGIYGVSWTSISGVSNLSINDSKAAIAPAFLQLNDFRFATFFLAAVDNLTTSVYLNGFLQDPTTFNYSFYAHTLHLPGWTQGYYFNYGSGIYTVTNTTITGNADVEFWSTLYSSASNIVTSGDSFGVDVLQGNYTEFDNITSETGANAIGVMNSYEVFGYDLSSNGTDVNAVPSWAAYLFASQDVYLFTTTTTNGALGIYSDQIESFYYVGLTATNAYAALELLDTGFGEVTDLLVNHSYGVYADLYGYVDFYNWTFTNGSSGGNLLDGVGGEYVYGLNVVDSSGLYLEGITGPLAHFINASGPSSYGIEASTTNYSSFYNVTAVNNAEGVVVEGGQNVSAANITSRLGSFGFGILGAQNVTVANVTVSEGAAGALVESSENVTVANVTVSGVGVGVGVIADEYVLVDNVNSTAATPGPEYFSTTQIRSAPNAAVASIHNEYAEILHVSAYNAGFALEDNGSNELLAVNITSWYAQVGVQFNGTVNATVAEAFLFGSGIGVVFQNTTNVDLEASTLEASASYGVSVENGSEIFVTANNFVANNGASTNEHFDMYILQAASVGATFVYFDVSGVGNYWSDWNPAGGSYIIASGVTDGNPSGYFITNWLEFMETGLPAYTTWGFTLDTITYTTSAPLVFIPSWSLGDPNLGYVVDPPVGYTPTPASGTVPYTGVNTTVTIAFAAIPYTVTFDESGLASGTSWSVTFDGTPQSGTGSSIVFSNVIVGTYAYTIAPVPGYTALPTSGSVTLAGSDKTVDAAFTVVTYAVTFTESGLAPGTSWSVTLGSQTTPSTTNTIQFGEPNETYTYTIAAVAGYTANVTHGSITVQGQAKSVSIAFTAVTPVTYSVTFSETGLATGLTWSVTFAGTPKSAAAGATITFAGLANNTYSYTVGAVTGYTSSVTSNSVIVAGNSPSVTVTFSATSSPPPPASSGSSGGLSTLDWAIIGIVIALLIVGMLVALMRRGRGGAATTPAAATNPPPPKPWDEGSAGQSPPDPSEGTP